MEFIILAVTLVLALCLAMVQGFMFAPHGISDSELKRRINKGDNTAIHESHRRQLLPMLVGIQTIKAFLLVAAITILLVVTFSWWVGALIAIAAIILVQIIVAQGWLLPVNRKLQKYIETHALHAMQKCQPVMQYIAPRHTMQPTISFNSAEELTEAITQNTQALTDIQKARLLAALKYSDIKIADCMVPSGSIAVVDVNETIGPVLLDSLHASGHSVFIAVKKDINHIKGLVYMADLMAGHPDVKKVKDAVRPVVHYMTQDDHLQNVLSASLQTGRQLFIAVDNQGGTVGLITLRDALYKLLGDTLPEQTSANTDPAKAVV